MSYQVGPVYILPVESELEAPCSGNTEAACDLYCDTNMERLLDEGYDLDTVVEVPTIYIPSLRHD